jgi:DNA-binding HxlR family transcriptional regulator
LANDCYLSFCPIAKVGEVIEPRWTLLILCELFNGATRFNEIHRGIPDISPTLLSRRLKEMDHNGPVIRRVRGPRNEMSYPITQAAEDLKPIVHAGLRPMTSVFLGYTTLLGEVDRGRIQLTGSRELAATMKDWFVPSVYSIEEETTLQSV